MVDGFDEPGAASGTPVAAPPESDDLQASLRDLAKLVSGESVLEELLRRVATYAVRAIPGADGAGVTLLIADQQDNRVQAMVASAPFVSEIDAIQYDMVAEGPCITAAREGRTVRSGSLGGESRWPKFGPRVGRLGVHSVLSLPLLLPDRVIGAINVYAHGKDVFDERAAEMGELFATPAAVAVHNAQVLAQAQKVAGQLQAALTNRTVIDQAIGILRSRVGGTAEEGFTRLRAMSQAENTKLSVVAQQVVDAAVRRANARHSNP